MSAKEVQETKEIVQPVEHIIWRDQNIATIVRASYEPETTTFVTPDSYYQQLGFVVYPKGGEVKRHSHLPLQRHLVGTPEVILLRRGKAEIDLYALDRSHLGTWTLNQGDIILLVAGGHYIRCLEDTVFLEIKQGPYQGIMEKEMF